jgi:hypothetical protein
MVDPTPLLGTCAADRQTDPAAAADLERGLAAGADFESLVDSQPEAVLSFLAKRGMRILGTFRVEVRRMFGRWPASANEPPV